MDLFLSIMLNIIYSESKSGHRFHGLLLIWIDVCKDKLNILFHLVNTSVDLFLSRRQNSGIPPTQFLTEDPLCVRPLLQRGQV